MQHIHNTYYFCDTKPSSESITDECVYDTAREISNGIQIDNYGGDIIQIDQIMLIDNYNMSLIIEYLCTESNSSNSCGDNVSIKPLSNLFIPLQSNNSQVIVEQSHAGCNLCATDFITIPYGGSGGSPKYGNTINKIVGITSWRIKKSSPKTLEYLQWISSNGDVSNIDYHLDISHSNPCHPFNLSTDEYINGYEVLSSSVVQGLVLYTNSNHTYNCTTSNEPSDSGKIIYKNYYLSGFT